MESEIKERIARLRAQVAKASELEHALEQHGLAELVGLKHVEEEKLLRAAFFSTTGRGNNGTSKHKRSKKYAPKVDFIRENKQRFQVSASGNQRDRKSPEDEKKHAYVQLQQHAAKIRKQLPLDDKPKKKKPERKKKFNKSAVVLPPLGNLLAGMQDKQEDELEREFRLLRRQFKDIERSRVEPSPLEKLKNETRVRNKTVIGQKVSRELPNMILGPILRGWVKSKLSDGLARWREWVKRVNALESYYQGHLPVVVRLQAWVRGTKSRINVAEMLQVVKGQRRRLEEKAALVAQNAWRKHKAYMQYKSLLEAKRRIQLHELALRIARLWRGFLARRNVWRGLRKSIWSVLQTWFGSVQLQRALAFLDKNLSSEKRKNAGVRLPSKPQNGKISALPYQSKVHLRSALCDMMDSKTPVPKRRGQVFCILMKHRQVVESIQNEWKELQTKELTLKTIDKREQAKTSEEKRRVEELARRSALEEKARKEKQAKQAEEVRRQKQELAALKLQRERKEEEAERLRSKQVELQQKEMERVRLAKELAVRETKEQRIKELKERHSQELRNLVYKYEVDKASIATEVLPALLRDLEFEFSTKRRRIREHVAGLERQHSKLVAELEETFRTEKVKLSRFDSQAQEAASFQEQECRAAIRHGEMDNAGRDQVMQALEEKHLLERGKVQAGFETIRENIKLKICEVQKEITQAEMALQTLEEEKQESKSEIDRHCKDQEGILEAAFCREKEALLEQQRVELNV